VPAEPLREELIDAASERLIWDADFRAAAMARLTQLGAEVEAALGGGPQDVEGVFTADGGVAVVQARPQVV
jgi:hypothetical protein